MVRRAAPHVVLLLLALLAGTALAQGEPVVATSAEVDRDTITVGDRIVYTVRAEHDQALVVDFPQLATTWDAFEVLGQQPLKPARGEQGRVVTGKSYILTAFAVGRYATPPLQVSYLDGQGQAHDVLAPSIPITVTSVLTATEGVTSTLGVVPTPDIRDLKPQAKLPPDWSWLPWAAAATLALALLAGAALWLRTRRKAQAAESAPAPIVDLRPPEEIAYEELARIAGLDLVPQQRYKEHYSLTADCLRRYAEGLYGVPAMDRTTEELHAALRRARVDGDSVRLFRSFLDESDLVKFAKYVPPVEEARQRVPRARQLVDLTRPQREVESPTEAAGRLAAGAETSAARGER